MDLTAPPEPRFCSECGRPAAPDELAHFGDRLICPYCKDAYAQKLREGVAPAVGMRYAGFWWRFLASLIDSIILGVVTKTIQFALFPSLTVVTAAPPGANPFEGLGAQFAQLGWQILLSTVISLVYSVWFIGALGAVPGMMVCGLKVVRPDGSPVGYARALGRYFAAILSGLIIGIGYLLIAFDDQKRALHDMICDTRVIKTRG